MLADIKQDDVGDHAYKESIITYNDGQTRKVLVTEQEVPFPLGKLIVSCSDLEGNITQANQAFIDMSGWEREEIMGQPHCILRHPDMPASAFEALWDTVSKGGKWCGYVKNLRKDGAYYWVYATVIPNVRNGKTVGYTSVRRKPSRCKVDEYTSLYADLLNKES